MLRYFSFVVIAVLAAASRSDVLTSRSSVSNWGVQVSGRSSSPAIDGGGTSVAFISSAADLVGGDTNGKDDVFVYDRFWRVTTRVSVATGGAQANNLCQSPAISPDGRYVAFVSFATNLVPNDTNNQADIFVHDRVTQTTARVSVGTGGLQANHESRNPSIGGGLVCFDSFASNLVPSDTNQMPDVFTYNLATGETKRVSSTWNGVQANGMSDQSKISADGTAVAFRSNATNLVPDDINMADDVFVRSLINSNTELVSRNFNFEFANSNSAQPSISSDGRYVAFVSTATDLVPDDTNGVMDVFVRDNLCMFTQRASLSTGHEEGDGPSSKPSVSGDGRFVSFFTFATNLVDQPLGFNENVVLRDTWMFETSLVSRNTPGVASNFISQAPVMSESGRFVAYESFATNLVSDDTNNNVDVYLADFQATSVGPSQFQIVRGNLLSGNVGSLQTSDDQKLLIGPGVTFSSEQDPIELYVIGDLGTSQPASLDVVVESSANTGNIRQKIEIFDYQSCTWKLLAQGPTSLIDSFHNGQPVGPMSDFISMGQVWVRITYRTTGPVFASPWQARLDQVRFVISE